MSMLFTDRQDAGRRLAPMLRNYAARPGVVVLGLARGGVPVAAEVARALGAPLDVLIVRKVGMPGNAEFAMGAIASGGACVLNQEAIRQFRVSAEQLEASLALARHELARREQALRGNRPPVDMHGSTVIIVDDGMATGSTMRSAVEAIRRQHPVRIIVAVPVAARDACDVLRGVADECHCLSSPPELRSVGEWYRDFSQTEDREVRVQLEQSMRTLPEDWLQSAHRLHLSATTTEGAANGGRV